MAGAWELSNHEAVQVCILHTDVVTLAWSFGLRNLIIPGGLPILPLAGMPYDHARNAGAQEALNRGAQWCFFLDSDVIPPRDTIPRLMAHRQPIMSGVYHRRSPPHAIPVMLKDGRWLTDYPKNAIIEVDLVGAGCLLVHRSCLEATPPQRPGKRWFDWTVDMAGHMEVCTSEDFTWNNWVRKHGFKVLADTSVQCRHVGYGEAMLHSFLPLNTCPVT